VLAVAAILAAAVFEVHELQPIRSPSAAQLARLIPPGACVVTDEASDLISIDRFGIPPGCPDVIDGLATTLVFSHGISIQGGAARLPAVVGGWQAIFSRARYVLLSPGHVRRVPPSAWFDQNFTPVGAYQTGIGQLYERKG
jgi:hypothetical protein